jgi:hypothetical protein
MNVFESPLRCPSKKMGRHERRIFLGRGQSPKSASRRNTKKFTIMSRKDSNSRRNQTNQNKMTQQHKLIRSKQSDLQEHNFLQLHDTAKETTRVIVFGEHHDQDQY